MPEEVTPAAESTVTEGATTEIPAGSEVETLTEGAGLEAASESSTEEPVRYAVKVGGAEQEVTLDELVNGYQRQSDYTRKTQELSAERQRLAQAEALAVALERNPQQTIATLAAAMGVNLSPAQANQIAEELDEDQQFKRDVSTFIQTEHQRRDSEARATAEQAALRAQHDQISRDLADLHQGFGEFDDNTVVQFAVDNQIPNLRAALMAWRFEQQQTQAIAEKNKITEQKRKAQVVAPGSHQAKGSTVSGATGRISIRDAFKQAIAAAQ